MNCQDALTDLLAADPSALRREGDTNLSRHIAGCRSCARVADQLLLDTHALAGAFRTAPLQQKSPLVPRLALAGGALAIALLMWPGNERRQEATGSNERRQETGNVKLEAGSGRQVATEGDDGRQVATEGGSTATAGDGGRQGATSSQASALLPVAYVPVAEPAPQPAPLPEPVRPEPVAYALEAVDPVTGPESGGSVRIDPPEGVEARVLATRNPRITVVWFN
ncbi:MAG TPA: hypothetical protein PLL69_07700 [Gemmatimonadales bacterium]|nr:hypothetical protein [Gemmatimonadales bacterium]